MIYFLSFHELIFPHKNGTAIFDWKSYLVSVVISMGSCYSDCRAFYVEFDCFSLIISLFWLLEKDKPRIRILSLCTFFIILRFIITCSVLFSANVRPTMQQIRTLLRGKPKTRKKITYFWVMLKCSAASFSILFLVFSLSPACRANVRKTDSFHIIIHTIVKSFHFHVNIIIFSCIFSSPSPSSLWIAEENGQLLCSLCSVLCTAMPCVLVDRPCAMRMQYFRIQFEWEWFVIVAVDYVRVRMIYSNVFHHHFGSGSQHSHSTMRNMPVKYLRV